MAAPSSLKIFPSLTAPHVRIADEEAVYRTIRGILENGPDCLQVVTDFDMTLTKQHIDGRKVLTSFGIFSRCKQLPPSYATESGRLFKKYRPIEIDPTLPLETKIEAMNDWMIAAEELLRGLPFDPSEIPEVTAAYQGTLRDGTCELFRKLRDAGVPVLVFSAGLGDIVEAVLKLNGVLFENVKVISNFLKYKNGYLDGFSNEKLLHVFNKNEHALEQDYFRSLKRRKNVLLMGDSIGDAGMIDGMEETNNVLKIGFLYDQVEHSLPSYMEKFDLVLIDDQTMNVPTDVLRRML